MAAEGMRRLRLEASLSSSGALVESGRGPLPPFTHHVYIGHSFKDSIHVQALCQKLENRHHIKCYPRHIRGDDSGNESIKQRIDEGVGTSEKCLLLMSTEYEGDVFSNYEVQTVHDKAKRFSNHMIIVIWLNRASRSEFNCYKYFVEQMDLVSYCNDLDKVATLAELIRPTMTPEEASLVCLPKENIGYGAATGFFYGFLRLVLPGFRERCHKAVRNFDKAGGNMIARTIGKMLIILPKSCFATQTLTKEDKIEVVKDLNVTRWANRAGNVLRDYKSTMYKLIVKQPEEVFYFAGELATPLLTLFETYYYGLLGMTLDQLYRERDAFCYTLHQVLQHPDNRECNDQFRLIMWDDSKNQDGKYNLELYDLLLPILREELHIEQVVQSSQDHQSSLSSGQDSAVQEEARADARVALRAAGFGTDRENKGENNAASTERDETFKIEGEDFTSLAEFWDSRQVNRYILRNGTRGKALIINIINFQASCENLKKRCGAEQDEETMKKLFDELGFECDVHRDVTKSNFERILMTYNSMDHSDCDAFICCIMTHGRLGKIYTADSQPYRILDVVDMFSSNACPSLKGKPKVFFVQSCQRGSESDSPDASLGRLASERAALDKDTPSEPPRAPGSGKASLVTDAMPDQDDEPGCGTTSGTQESASVNHQSAAAAPSGQAAQNYSVASVGSSAGSSRQNSWEIVNAEERAVLVPGEPDILMSYSALPGSISYRDISRGSLYIEALAENLRKPVEIDRALKRVTADVEERVKEYERDQQTTYKRQLPFHLTTGMSKLLYLTPVKRV